MKEIITLIQLKMNAWVRIQKRRVTQYFFQNKWKFAFIAILLYAALEQDWNFTTPSFFTRSETSILIEERASFDMTSVIASILHGSADNKKVKEKNLARTVSNPSKQDGNLGNTYSNVSFWGGKNDGLSKRAEKRASQEAYVQRFVKIAQTEAGKYNIPASVILAQGILESNAGASRLAQNNNNHFGMKCFSSNCQKGHCSNFTDDSHKDFFKKYESPWKSYRDHSILLKRPHYRSLFKLNAKDYRSWAVGLKRCGYATDPHYAESLIRTIEDLNLQQYD